MHCLGASNCAFYFLHEKPQSTLVWRVAKSPVHIQCQLITDWSHHLVECTTRFSLCAYSSTLVRLHSSLSAKDHPKRLEVYAWTDSVKVRIVLEEQLHISNYQDIKFPIPPMLIPTFCIAQKLRMASKVLLRRHLHHIVRSLYLTVIWNTEGRSHNVLIDVSRRINIM